MDVFCMPEDHRKIIDYFRKTGYKTEYTDERWLDKIFWDDHYIDLIYSSANRLCTVDREWFKNAKKITLFGTSVQLVPPEEMIWQKIYIQDRDRYDGPDILHIMNRYGKSLDWRRLYDRLYDHSQLLMSYILLFFFVYPSDGEIIPGWLLDDLNRRLQEKNQNPENIKVCRGPYLSRTAYETDIKKWGYNPPK